MNPKATRKNKSTNLVSLSRVCLRLLFIIRCAFCIHSVVAMGGDAMKAIWHFKRISDDERPSPANENFPFLIAALSFILSIFKDLQADSRSRMFACLHPWACFFFCVCMKNGYMRDCVMKKKGESWVGRLASSGMDITHFDNISLGRLRFAKATHPSDIKWRWKQIDVASQGNWKV